MVAVLKNTNTNNAPVMLLSPSLYINITNRVHNGPGAYPPEKKEGLRYQLVPSRLSKFKA